MLNDVDCGILAASYRTTDGNTFCSTHLNSEKINRSASVVLAASCAGVLHVVLGPDHLSAVMVIISSERSCLLGNVGV